MSTHTPDTLLLRKQAAEALTAEGYPTAEATLATKAVRGGGPAFQRYGNRVLYRWGDVLTWAKGRMTPPVKSTAELDKVPPSSKRYPPAPGTGRGRSGLQPFVK